MRQSGTAPSRNDHLIGLALGAAYLVVLLATAGDVGYSRDEGFYFTAARRYQAWFDVLEKDGIFQRAGKLFRKDVHLDQAGLIQIAVLAGG